MFVGHGGADPPDVSVVRQDMIRHDPLSVVTG
jgi:hypothetical protein